MADLKIQVFKDGKAETTVKIPGGILKIASKLLPKKVTTALAEEGIDLDELIKLSTNPELCGTLVEVDEPEKGRRVIISLE